MLDHVPKQRPFRGPVDGGLQPMSVGLLFDATRCIGCNACAEACKEQNSLPLPIEPKTTAYTWTVVEPIEGIHVRRLCMHCLDPTCVSV